jgi:hypothetical protein
MIRRHLLVGLLGIGVKNITGCVGSNPPVQPPPPPPPPPPVQFHIEPAAPVIRPGASVQLRAVASTGGELGVSWRLGDGLFGTISAGGLLSTPLCGGTASSNVQALLLADTSQRAITVATLARSAPPSLNLVSLTYAPSGTPVHPDSIVGDIDVHLQLSECIEIGEWHLSLRQGNVSLTVATAAFTPPSIPPQPQTLQWHADSVPNGDYTLSAAATGPQVQLASNSVSISVRHP